jgi:hypothetical protein
MKQSNNVTDFEIENEFRQKLIQDAKVFDKTIDPQIQNDLFRQIDLMSQSDKQEGSHLGESATTRIHWKWASIAAVLAVVAFSWTMTGQQQHQNQPTMANNQHYDPVIAAYQPMQPAQPMIQSQVLTNEYMAILSDIEKLATRIRVD